MASGCVDTYEDFNAAEQALIKVRDCNYDCEACDADLTRIGLGNYSNWTIT